MALKYLPNRITGLSTDPKPTNPQLNTIFWETDTLSSFMWNGSTWLKEDDQPETFTNKTLDAADNTFQNLLVSPFSLNFKRFGGLVPGSTATGSLFGTLGGWTSSGTFSTEDDIIEGSVNRFSSSTNGATLGYLSHASSQLIAQRAWNTILTVKAKVSTTTDSRLFIGFSSNNTLPSSDTILGDTEQGILIGFSTIDFDFSVFTNDGGGTMSTTTMAVTKDTGWHTYEIAMTNNGSIVCKIDDISTATISARLPNNTTALYGNAVMQLAAASAMTLDIKGIQFVADR